MVFLDLLDLAQQAVQGLAGKTVAVERDQATVGGDHRRHGVEVQRRRRIQVNPVVILGQLIKQLTQLVDLVLGLQLGLQVSQLGGGRDQMQVVERGLVDIDLTLLGKGAGRQGLFEEVGDARRHLVASQTGEIVGGITLGIEVDQQGAMPLCCTDRCQIAGNAGFTHATFLIEHHAPHATPP